MNYTTDTLKSIRAAVDRLVAEATDTVNQIDYMHAEPGMQDAPDVYAPVIRDLLRRVVDCADALNMSGNETQDIRSYIDEPDTCLY